MRTMLEIRNMLEMRVALTDAHCYEIKEYLDLLDLTVDLDVVSMSDSGKVGKHTAISQPGLRYSQAEALVKILMKDSVFSGLSLAERNAVTKRILSDIQSRMMEDIVLLETKITRPDCKVFKLLFDLVGFHDVIPLIFDTQI